MKLNNNQLNSIHFANFKCFILQIMIKTHPLIKVQRKSSWLFISRPRKSEYTFLEPNTFDWKESNQAPKTLESSIGLNINFSDFFIQFIYREVSPDFCFESLRLQIVWGKNPNRISNHSKGTERFEWIFRCIKFIIFIFCRRRSRSCHVWLLCL